MAIVLKNLDRHRAPQEAHGASGLTELNLDDLAAMARRQLQESENRAREVIVAAGEEAEKIRAQAYQEGLLQGRAAGERETEQQIRAGVEKRLREELPLFESLVIELATSQSKFLTDLRGTLVSTSLAIAERIIVARLEREPEILERWTQAALDAARTARNIVLVVHPETLAMHGTELEQLLQRTGNRDEVRIEASEEVPVAGVMLRCDGGAIDMSLGEQLARLDELIRGTEEGTA